MAQTTQEIIAKPAIPAANQRIRLQPRCGGDANCTADGLTVACGIGPDGVGSFFAGFGAAFADGKDTAPPGTTGLAVRVVPGLIVPGGASGLCWQVGVGTFDDVGGKPTSCLVVGRGGGGGGGGRRRDCAGVIAFPQP